MRCRFLKLLIERTDRCQYEVLSCCPGLAALIGFSILDKESELPLAVGEPPRYGHLSEKGQQEEHLEQELQPGPAQFHSWRRLW